MLDLDYERYKEFDFSGATHTKNPKILQAQAKKRAYDAFVELFDSDVRQICIEHNTPQDRIRLNAVIRALYMTA